MKSENLNELKSVLHLYDILDFVQVRTRMDLTTPCRKRPLAYTRNVYYKLCRQLTDHSLEDIGQSVNRDHCSVIHGIKCFDNRVMDRKYYALFENILNDLLQIDDKARTAEISLLPRPKIIEYFENKITAIHVEYLTKISEIEKQRERSVENKAILSVANELSKLSDGDIHIFIETRLKPFILTR